VTATTVVTECDKSFDVPVIVRVVVVGAAEAAAASVMLLEPEALAGSNEAVTPFGSPATLRTTLPSKLPLGIAMILAVALRPWGTDTLADDAVSVKSLGPAFGEGRTS
jgi:hypothetical protein